MKKTFAPQLLALCLALVTLLSLAGCKQAGTGDTPDSRTPAEESVQEPADQQETELAAEPETDIRTVTFYDSDGETVLNTVEVPLGETVQPENAEKDGYTFVGWFATPKLVREFDFTKAIREDTAVYAGFASQMEDTREFAILGFGASPLLAESNWGAVINDEHRMTKEDAEGKNVYTITVDLEEGDMFQFAIDGTWADQRGFGYIEDAATQDEPILRWQSAATTPSPSSPIPGRTAISPPIPSTPRRGRKTSTSTPSTPSPGPTTDNKTGGVPGMPGSAAWKIKDRGRAER